MHTVDGDTPAWLPEITDRVAAIIDAEGGPLLRPLNLTVDETGGEAAAKLATEILHHLTQARWLPSWTGAERRASVVTFSSSTAWPD